MARLPNGDRAVVDMAKLTTYALNPAHPLGGHKARVFAAALGLTIEDAPMLRTALLWAAVRCDAVFVDASAFGERYRVVFQMEHGGRKARVRSLWTIDPDQGYPHLASAIVAKKDRFHD